MTKRYKDPCEVCNSRYTYATKDFIICRGCGHKKKRLDSQEIIKSEEVINNNGN